MSCGDSGAGRADREGFLGSRGGAEGAEISKKGTCYRVSPALREVGRDGN
jgi:hypothetical protein